MVKKIEMLCFNRNQFQHTDMLKEVEMLLARLFNDFFLSIKSCFTIIFRSGVDRRGFALCMLVCPRKRKVCEFKKNKKSLSHAGPTA